MTHSSGIRYTHKIKPHSCPLHDNGPIWELQLKKVTSQLSDSPSSAEASKLNKTARKLRSNIARYERHLKQYEVCRTEVKAEEDALAHGDGKCVMYRDFVNCYNEKGEKVKNLIFTKITRGENGELVVQKINNFCTDKNAGCNAFFVADVMDFHLTSKSDGGSGFFDDIKEIVQSGDHGPHFACNETIFHESQLFAKYGKKLRNKFLCSYHAYNRCDGAGVNVKKEAELAARDDRGPLSAHQQPPSAGICTTDDVSP